ncbi:MAG: TldD/PmbA family protein [Planctomycetota bacterium]
MSDRTAEEILELASGRFDAAEVYEEASETVSVKFEDNRLKEIRTRQRRGVGLRVIHEGRIGFASTTDLREPGNLLEMAGASAQFGDAAKFEFPAESPRAAGPDLHDEAVTEVSAAQMVEMGREGLQRSREANEDYLFGAGLSRSLRRERILNTAGLDCAYQSTDMSSHVEIELVADEGLLRVYEYKDWGRPFGDVMDLTEEALEKMDRAATLVPARVEEMPMIFAPKALNNLFTPISVALNGKRVHKGSSVLRGRIDERIIDERLTIADDPEVDWAPGSCPFDDEGTPARRRAIFDAGVLKTCYADLQTAGLLGIEPTGHGFRGYSSRPSPSSTNVVVEPGETPFEEMLSGIERGVIVDQTLGSGQSNLLAGEFSVNVELGFMVEKGEVRGRVKDCMAAGNVYEVLRQVEAIGSERRWLGSNCAPPIMVGGLKLAAQGG